MWTIFKVVIDFVKQYCFLFMFCCCFLFWLQGMWNLSSPNRDLTHTPCIRRWSLNQWATRKSQEPKLKKVSSARHRFWSITRVYSFKLPARLQGASRVVLVVKNPPANTGGAGDMGSILGPRRSLGSRHKEWEPPLQYSCLENSMERKSWWATVHGVAKSWTQLSDWAQNSPTMRTTLAVPTQCIQKHRHREVKKCGQQDMEIS